MARCRAPLQFLLLSFAFIIRLTNIHPTAEIDVASSADLATTPVAGDSVN
jgi:hypothetical protein